MSVFFFFITIIFQGDCCRKYGGTDDNYYYFSSESESSEEFSTNCTICACLDPTVCSNKYGDETCGFWAKNHCDGVYKDWMEHNCYKACYIC